MAHRLWSGRRMSALVVMSLVYATTGTTLTLGGRRARGFLRLAATAMMLRAARLVTLRGRCGCLPGTTIALAAPAEKREWATVTASGLRFLPPYGTCHLHLVAALLSNPFVTSESSTPHTEPAVDGRCLVTTAHAVFVRSPVDLKHGFYSENEER